MSEHRIAITLSDNAAIPVPANATLRVGDTVVYVTNPPNLRFRVKFLVSPFIDRVIKNSSPRTVIRKGKFECRCFITPPTGKEVGWRRDAPQSGGEHDVKP